jgi:hypothetical protein
LPQSRFAIAFFIFGAVLWTIVSVFPGIVAGVVAGLLRNVLVCAAVGAIVFATVPLVWIGRKLGSEGAISPVWMIVRHSYSG